MEFYEFQILENSDMKQNLQESTVSVDKLNKFAQILADTVQLYLQRPWYLIGTNAM